jgi:hypothetical protein
MKVSIKKYIFLVCIFIIVTPFLSAILYCFYKWVFEKINYSGYLPSDIGGFGDIFGISTSIFSGLAFAGLIYVLSKDLENRNKQEKPVPSLIFEDGDLQIFRKKNSAYSDSLHLKIKSKIKNYSDCIAIGARVRFTIMAGGRELNSEWRHLPEPIGDGYVDVDDFVFDFNNDGNRLEDRFNLVKRLDEDELFMYAYIGYQNLNGVDYISKLTYRIKNLEIYKEKLKDLSSVGHINVDSILQQGDYILLRAFSKEYKHELIEDHLV